MHITGGGGATGFDLADIYLFGLLGLGILYLALELRQKNGLRRLAAPGAVVAVSMISLAFTFGLIPASQVNSPPSGSVFVSMWPGSYQNATEQPQGFVPQNITVILSINATVAWENRDSVMHTAHSDIGEFDLGQVQPGQTKWYTFTRPGVFAYHCDPHPWRTGKVTVIAV